jgi:hypothetical protein
MRSDATHHPLSGTVRVFENGTLFAERQFDEAVPRGL